MKMRRTLGAAAAFCAIILPNLTFASTAANTQITNTVTVNFQNAAGAAQTAVTSSVSFTVNLVASIPLVSSPAAIDPTTENTPNNLTYTITGTANGFASYNLSASDTKSQMDNDAAFEFRDASNTSTITQITNLGGTTVAVDTTAGATVITVPDDQNISGAGSINNISVGDVIVIDPGSANAETATVTAINETASNNTLTITIDTDTGTAGNQGLANAHLAGVIIGEQQTFILKVTTDTITPPNATGTHTVSTTATDTVATGISGSQTTATVITVRKPLVTVTKYVRNVSGTNPGSGGINIGGTDYFTSGVSGKPGDVMEYMIVVDNTATGGGVANNIIVSDTIPEFTSLNASAIHLLAASTAAMNAVAIPSTSLTPAEDGDAAEQTGSTLYVYAGTGGIDNSGTPGTGGSLNQGERSYIQFQVTIN